jgi:hypothetical protein
VKKRAATPKPKPGKAKTGSAAKRVVKTSAAKNAARKSGAKGAAKKSAAKKSAGQGAVKKGAARNSSPARKTAGGRAATPAGTAARQKPATGARPAARATSRPSKTAAPRRVPRLERDRRLLDDETLLTPPSSLDMDRHGSAVRTGRAELAEARADHATMTPDIAAGDVDVDVEDAYFTGDEAPGGDNPTPDQDVVDEIGKALGVEYADNEELRASDKVTDRDKSRWELDPASAEDYRDRDKE